MQIIVLFIFLIATFCSIPEEALARPIEETVSPQGFLIPGNLRQWTSLTYEYTGHDSNIPRANSNTNRFREKYHISLSSAILDPHLLNLSLDGEVWLEQAQLSDAARGSQTSRSTQYQYNLAGSLFDQDPIPITFLSSRELRDVVTPFTPSYTTDTFVNGATAVVRNKYVPLLFRYWRISTDITGIGSNNTTTANNYYLQAEHEVPDLSHSRLTSSVTTQRQETLGLLAIDSRNYSVSLSNAFELDRRKKYTLSSSVQGYEAVTGEIPQQNLHWLETLNCRFGRALWGIFSYRYDYDKTLGFDNRDQISKYNEFDGTITHRLFASLDTAITGRYRTGDILDGEETIYGGSAGVTYRKDLPQASHLLLSVKGEHEITDRHLPGTQFSVRDEEHRGVQQGDSISLNVSGNLLLVVSVTSRNPDITYVEGLDYTVNVGLGRIDIVVGGGIPSGADLFISYSVQLNPMVKYATDTVNSTVNLSLFQNRYNILGNYIAQDRTILSSQADNIGLYNSRSAMVHADANFPPNSFNAEYGQYVSGPTNYSYWEGGWRFDYRFNRQSLSLKARDRYLTRETTGATKHESWENIAEFGTTYARPVFTWASVSAALNYANTQGEDIQRDYAYFRLNFQGRINKLFINLIGQSILRIRPAETARDDYVMLEVKRYF